MHGLLISILLLMQAIAPAGGVVTGRLLNADGSPASKVRVSVMPVQEGDSQAGFLPGLSNLSETDAAGNFRILDVAPGRYYVVAGLLEFPTFHPGTRDLSAATIVSVTSAATISGIDFRVAPVSGGLLIAGRVVGLEALASNVRTPVTVSASGRAYFTATVKPDGTFEIPKVLPGRYSLRVSSQILNGGSTNPSVEAVDKDVRGVEINVYRLKTITGRIQLDGRGAIPLILARFANTEIFLRPEPAVPNAREGTFRITVPESETRIDLPRALPPGYAIKSFTYGDTDLTRNPLKVTAADNTEIRLVLSTPDRPPVKVSGRVAGLEMADFPVRVTLQSGIYPQPMVTRPAADGTFEFPEVFPGEYSVRIPDLDVRNTPAIPITAGDSDVRNIELKLPEKKEIRGRLIVEGGAPLPRLSLTWSSAPGRNANGTPIEPQPDGSFKIALYEGSHTDTSFDLPRGYTRESIQYGTSDLTNGRLTVSASDNAELRIVLKAANLRPVKVSGRAAGGESVSLKSSSYAATLNARVAGDGTFEFPSVLPGNYALFLTGAAVPAKTCAPVVVGDTDLRNVSIAAPPRGAQPPDVNILSAIFGANDGSADVTPMVRKWMKPDAGNLYAAPNWLEVDPAVSQAKNLVISYLYQCEEHRLTVIEPWPVNYNILVEHADPRLRPSPAASANAELKVLEAYYGNGNQFRTVTPRVRELLAAGNPVLIDDASLNVNVNSTWKQLLVAYSYKGIPSTYIALTGRQLSSAELVTNAEAEMLRSGMSEAPPWFKEADPFAPREPGDPGPGYGTAVSREVAIAHLLKALAQLKALAPADTNRNVLNIMSLIEQGIADVRVGMNYRYPPASSAPLFLPIRPDTKSVLMGNAARSMTVALNRLANANPGQNQIFLDLAMSEVRDALKGLDEMRQR
jgi:hypothetical protein